MAQVKLLTVRKIAKIAVPILKKNGVKQAGIVGSYAKGKPTQRSDIDLVVKTKKGISLFEFAGLKLDLEQELHKKVDLVEYASIKPAIKQSMLQHEVRIL